MFTPSNLLYEGKCKKIFNVQKHEDKVWMEFKDQLTAYNGEKKSFFLGKGSLNRDTTSLIFRYLNKKGHKTHWIQDQNASCMVALKIKMIPLEVVIRNQMAGSTAQKFKIKEGQMLSSPLFELYYKDETLGDPFISLEQALMLGASNEEEIQKIKSISLKINQDLLELFQQAGMQLVDFKLEFGRTLEGDILLGDEISADSCRIWEKGTGYKLDKDRFRLDLGDINLGYQKIYSKLSKVVESKSK